MYAAYLFKGNFGQENLGESLFNVPKFSLQNFVSYSTILCIAVNHEANPGADLGFLRGGG